MVTELATPARAKADGVFDDVLLSDLITWAAYDQQTIDIDDYMREHYEGWGRWNQGVWARKERDAPVCGTAFCMAGQAVAQAGYAMVTEHGEIPRQAFSIEYCAPIEGYERDEQGRVTQIHVDATEPASLISEVGREVLGLDGDEADIFFAADNSISELVSLAQYFCQKRGMLLQVAPEILAMSRAPLNDAAFEHLRVDECWDNCGSSHDDDEDDDF